MQCAHIGVNVYINAVHSIPPFLTPSPADSTQTEGASDKFLSQTVYGELVILMCIYLCRMSVKHLSFSAEHPGYLILFRMHVSRKVADDWEALLDGVGLEMPTIKTCSENHSGEVESTVQAGLTKWCDGQSQQPPTWQVLLEAMDHAGIDPKNIDQLKKDLLKPPLTFIEGTYIHCICIL